MKNQFLPQQLNEQMPQEFVIYLYGKKLPLF